MTDINTLGTGLESNGFKEAADRLRSAASDKNVALWPTDSNSTMRSMEVSLIPQDKGLTFLAKRAYKQLNYSDAQAKDAAILLSAKFVEKMGPDPKLGTTAVLKITPDYAELISANEGGIFKNETVYLTEAAEKVADAPVRLTVDAPNEIGKSLDYDAQLDHGFRSFLTRFYKNNGDEAGKAAEAAGILYGKFVQVNKGSVPQMKDGDRLTISPTKAMYKSVDGREGITISLSDEAAIVEHYHEAKNAIVDTSRMKQQEQVFKDTAAVIDAYKESLKDRLVLAVPNAIVFGHDRLIAGMEGYAVNMNGSSYYVIQNLKGEYKLNQLKSVNDGNRLTGLDTKVNWTKDFEEIKKHLA